MAVLNSDILQRAWIEGSNMFQQRIPNPSIAGMAATCEKLFDPMNNDLFNEFSGLLNGLIGTYIEGQEFENPLRMLKKPMGGDYVYGNSERHVAIKYLQAHTPKWDDETLLKVERPEFVEWFYSVNMHRRYEFSWNKFEIMRAFNRDGYGFEELLTRTFATVRSSDNYDEMMAMIQCFAEADNRLPGGIFRVNLSAAPTTEATSKELLRKIRATAGNMKFPSLLYNHIDVPAFETGDSLIVWLTPETNSYLDVEALSAVFQLDKADIKYRVIEIPEFPIPNVYAAVTSNDFIFARDVWYGMEPPFYDPSKRDYKYYLYHDQMIGANPAANAVIFTTDAATNVETVTIVPTGLAFVDDGDNTIYPGGTFQTRIALTGTGATGKIAVEPDAALYEVAAHRINDDDTESAVPLNSRTYVDDRGVLHAQKTGLETGDVITIYAKSVYINPSGSTTVFDATIFVDVVNEPQRGAKECTVETDPYIVYDNVPHDSGE